MTVDRADVVEAHLLEHRARQHHALHVLLGAAREFPHGRHAPEDLLAALAQCRIRLARQDAREVIGQRTDVLGDRHVVVVQDDEHVDVERAGVIQRLEGLAGAHRAVADHRHDAAVASGARGGQRHAEGRADRGAGMPDAERVELTFDAARKGREPVPKLDRAAGGPGVRSGPCAGRPGGRRPRPAGRPVCRRHSAAPP